MNRDKVFRKLKENGLPQNSGDWKDYELGKALFQNGTFKSIPNYEILTLWIAEYFDV